MQLSFVLTSQILCHSRHRQTQQRDGLRFTTLQPGGGVKGLTAILR